MLRRLRDVYAATLYTSTQRRTGNYTFTGGALTSPAGPPAIPRTEREHNPMKPLEHKVVALRTMAAHILKLFPDGGSGGTAALLAVQGQIHELAEGAAALRELVSARNPTETDGAHIKRASAAAQ